MAFLQVSTEQYKTPTSIAQKVALQSHLNQTTSGADILWQYPVPKLGEGGSCSLFGELEKQPFSLDSVFSKKDEALLEKLTHLTEYVRSQSKVDWFGIYLLKEVDDCQQLVKVAYYGAPSRALFPLTEQFSLISNNVAVALSQSGRIVNNVAVYLEQGGEYYNCDPKVKSELCLPLVLENGRTLGIIDAESFTTDFFDDERQAFFKAVCLELQEILANY